VEDCSILDLGSGAGRDCFVLSQLVGANGHVTGVDMTQEQVNQQYSTIDILTCNCYSIYQFKNEVGINIQTTDFF